jgi:hypothetical protein
MPPSFSDLSIVIPLGPGEMAWQELIPQLLAHFPNAEILLVSSLNPNIREPCCRWIRSESSHRARQLNLGAKSSKGKFLWFLHADSRIDSKTASALINSIQKFPNAVHYFDLQFSERYFKLTRFNEYGVWIRSHCLGMPFGDQGFCVSKKIFVSIGEFPENAPYGEDHLWIWMARRRGIRLRPTGATLKTSARKYIQKGWAKTTYLHSALTARQAAPEWIRLLKERWFG